jgi:hypothetical protein
MVAKRQDSITDDADMVGLNWDQIHTGEEVFMLSSGRYLGPYKVISSIECVLWDKESGLRFHYLGVLYAKNKTGKSSKGRYGSLLPTT